MDYLGFQKEIKNKDLVQFISYGTKNIFVDIEIEGEK